MYSFYCVWFSIIVRCHKQTWYTAILSDTENQQIMDFETEIGDIKCRCMADIDQKYGK